MATYYDPPLFAGSEGYIAPAAELDEPNCFAFSDDPDYPYCCTLLRGHDGNHAAHGPEGELYATWP